ncbi:T9SS type A sorting domain-containing protein [Flavobacterium sp. I3-2]|uniref:T9SS type A sorting domain-containing protein n=1 Tax=Flavobacterium sp. I3-2 TaxID=2748319 RepID=UPI0015B255D4|nr:T9SS type A sorting domain-containing protein [Flavobacterium sp. I3-2]
MKKITTLIFCIFIYFGIFAQTNQQQFLDNIWYLSKIEINNEEFELSSLTSTSYVLTHYITDGNRYFTQTQCNGNSVGYFTLVDDNSINFTSFTFPFDSCTDMDLGAYFTSYVGDIFGFNIGSDFDFTVTSSNGNLQLVIAGANGNKATYYNNATANIKSFNGQLLKVYPNPSTDFLNVSIGNLDKILIFDIQGKQIETKFITNAEETQIDIQHLAKGNYILQISNDNQTESLKFIKN